MTATRRSDYSWRALALRGLDLLWLAALAVYILAGIDRVPFHGDESTLVFMTRDYHYLVQQRDLDAVLYDPDIPIEQWEEQQLRLLNGTVPKMAMGLAWDLAGLTVDDITKPWHWGFTDPSGNWTEWAWNHANGHVPGDRMLRAVRWSSALQTVVAVWAIYAIAWLVARRAAAPGASTWMVRAAAWSASLIYVTHPGVLLNGRRAMMEGSLAAFSALTVLAALMLLRAAGPGAGQGAEPRARAISLWVVLVGVMAGTAISSKHTALLVVIPVGYMLCKAAPGWRGAVRLHWRRLAGLGVVVVLTFLAWNPAWWTFNPQIPAKVMEWRNDLLNYQEKEGRLYGTTYESVLDGTRGLVDSMFWAGPQYSEIPHWREWLAGDIDAYESSGLAGRLGGPVWAVIGLALLGAGTLCAGCSWRVESIRLLIAWGFVVAVGLVLLTPMYWARYYLPLQAPASVFAGLGAAWLLSIAARLVRRRA